MSFTAEEKEIIISYFNQFPAIEKTDVKNYVNDATLELLQEQRRLKTVADRLLFVNKTASRPYECLYVTKFLTPTFDISDCVKTIAGCISDDFLIFVDCHFCFLIPAEDEKITQLKFQCAYKSSAFNNTIKISTKDNYNDLRKEFDNLTNSDILNRCFEHHTDLYDYHTSDLRPYCLLSLFLHIQKI